MSPAYVRTVKKKDGRVYRYFRGPGSKAGTHQPRLSCDLGTAKRQVQAALILRGASARSVSAKLLANTKVRARRRGLVCDLSVSTIVEMMEAHGFRCAVSGL